VTAAHLGLTDPVVDATSVLTWSTHSGLATRLADLRSLAGDALPRAVLDWAAERAGLAGQALRPLLLAGEAADIVPLGLVDGLLADAGEGTAALRVTAETAVGPAGAVLLAREALIRLEPRFGGVILPTATLRSWAREAATVLAGMLREPAQQAS